MHRVHCNIALLALACLLAALPLAAQDMDDHAGEYGFQMLKIPTGPAAAATAGTGAANQGDMMAFFGDPTAPLLRRTTGVGFAYTSWIFDTTLNTVAYTRQTGARSFGLGMRYLDYGKMDALDDLGQVIGEFHPMDMDAVFNFAYRIAPTHYAGVNVHLLYEKIHTASSFGACADLGYTWLTPIQGMRAGLAVKYLGDTSAMDREDINLPHSFEASVAKDHRLGSVDLSGELRLIKYPDDDGIKSAIGLDARFFEMLDVRLGYKVNYDAESFSAGVGISWKRLRFDYAWLPFDEDAIDDVHVVGLSFML